MKSLNLIFVVLVESARSFVNTATRHLQPISLDPLFLNEAQKLFSTVTSTAQGITSDEEDDEIREALKRELLLLSSITNRGEYTSSMERDIIIDIVTQLGTRCSSCS